MKDFPGTPGTLTALILRISQCLFAAGSIASMATTSRFFQVTAFCYLMASMAVQVVWSFALGCLDTYALARKKVLHNPILVGLFLVGDWVTATLSLAAVASSAGIIVMYTRDFGVWKGEECLKYQISVYLAFFSWIMIGISSFIMFWILAAGKGEDQMLVKPKFQAMALDSCKFGTIYRRFKPHLLMVLAQIGYTFLYFLTEASFNRGMNPHVHITYRHIVAGVVMLPFAYFLERNVRPKLTLPLFIEIFVLSLLGVGLTLNMYFASLRYTSPTFLASMVNTIASLTFIVAVVLRLEVIDITSLRGMAKILGTLVSLAGVMTMTLYKGPLLRNLWGAVIHIQGNKIHENWLKGSILASASCITWSIWYIMQAFTLKKYPAQLSLTTWMSFIGAAQSAVFTACVEHKQAAWLIGFDINLWCIIYAGVVCSGLIIFIQLWCTEEKGPVFVTMFNPLSTVQVALLAYFVLGEELYIGSIVGGVIAIIGLYLLLWGKEKDQEVQTKSQEETKLHPITSEDKASQMDP